MSKQLVNNFNVEEFLAHIEASDDPINKYDVIKHIESLLQQIEMLEEELSFQGD
jgi:hypothetical protein